MKVSASLLLACGASFEVIRAIQLSAAGKGAAKAPPEDITDVEESSQSLQAMWNAAVDVEDAPVEESPFHFDLLGLAQGFTKTASTAAYINKLKESVHNSK